MLKPFTAEGRFECGLNDVIAGKIWAFVAIVGSPNTLGVAIANAAGYVPVPTTWCHADTFSELNAHVDELNAAEGLDRSTATNIVASTMRKVTRSCCTVEIQGSHGVLIADIATGKIVDRPASEGDEKGYPEIERFDPTTLKGDRMDILECGYWSKDGAYLPPEPDFVAHVANVEAGGEGLL